MEIVSVIKFEGDDRTLVWKHPKEDFNTMSQLIVHETQEAIFFKDGKALDVFKPGKYTLKTGNIPLLNKIINIPTDGVSAFHCEVYFVNKAMALNMKWGTSSQFTVLDPNFNIPLNVGASGSLEMTIGDSREFVTKVVGTQKDVTTEKIIEYFKEKIVTKVKTYLSKIMSEVSYIMINQHLEDISQALQEKLHDDLGEYGINLHKFYLSTINIPEEDTFKVKEVLNKKLEYGTLNYNWADEQMAEIAKRYAENPGSKDNIGGMISQIPIAMTFGQMLQGNMQSFMGNGNLFSKANEEKSEVKEEQEVEENKSIKKFCTNCGNKLDENDKFCSNCGTKVK